MADALAMQLEEMVRTTVMSAFFAASNDDDSKRQSIISSVFALDRELEAKCASRVQTSWDLLNKACASAPSKQLNPVTVVGATPESLTQLYGSVPAPLTQLFVEAPLPTKEEVLSAARDPTSTPVPSTAASVLKSFLLGYFAMPFGPVDEKILDCLTSIQSQTLPLKNEFEDREGFQIIFSFDNNVSKNYFKNKDLRLTVLFGAPGRFSISSATERVVATKIDWIVDPTIQRVEVPPTVEASSNKSKNKKRGRDEEDDKKSSPAASQFVEVKQPSFFHLFESFDITEDMNETDAQDEEAAGAYEALQLKRAGLLNKLQEFHAVIAMAPFAALKNIMPEEDDGDDGEDDMQSDDDEYFEGGDEEDDLMDDDDEFDEDDAPPPPPPKKKQQGGPAPSSKKKGGEESKTPAPQKPDCKQQ